MNNVEVSEYDKDLRKEHRTTLKSYAGFLSVIVVALLTKIENIEVYWLILSLLSISIPSAIGSVNIERNTEYGKSNNSPALWLFSMVMIYIPSIAAFSILISTKSLAASAVFTATAIGWFIFIVKFRHVG